MPAIATRVIEPIEADRARIRAHLNRVKGELRAADVANLRDEQVAARSKAMDALHDYWLAGVFPQNRPGVGRNPVFVDEGGRACAVAHLMNVTGHDAMARRIADGHNRAYVLLVPARRLDRDRDQPIRAAVAARDCQLLRLNPVRLTATELRVELGLRGRATIPLAAIASVRAFEPMGLPNGVSLCVFGSPDMVLELHEEVAVSCGTRTGRTRQLALRIGALTRDLTDQR